MTLIMIDRRLIVHCPLNTIIEKRSSLYVCMLPLMLVLIMIVHEGHCSLLLLKKLSNGANEECVNLCKIIAFSSEEVILFSLF